MSRFDLHAYDIQRPRIHRNSGPAPLYEAALANEPGTAIASSGALIARSGSRTGRSPKAKRIVREPATENEVWWGDINIDLPPDSFEAVRRHAAAALDSRDDVYVVDGFAGADPEYRVRVRVICERAYHALFMYNMLIRPTAEELESFGEPDVVIYNAGTHAAPEGVEGVRGGGVSVSLSLERGIMVILGSEYAGEMKKGVFTLMNHRMPRAGILSMHCSANEGEKGDVSVFFGLSGTGKTTLSADPRRALIGDDEHCWTDGGVFNIEGGCYAKAIGLSAEAEPAIFGAIRFGAVLENVVHDPATHEVDFDDGSITQNTRCAYPVDFIPNARIPGVGGIPDNIIFLTCDAFSVLPPVSRLTPEQAMYHFISGYTAKISGTEVGITEPEATFSACFGAPFLVWHPTVYAEMLAERIRRHGSRVWMVNTGWTGGPYGTGQRMRLAHTRAIIDAIHDGLLEQAETQTDPVFGVGVPKTCPGVPDEVLVPADTWPDREAYRQTAADLVRLFDENFARYAELASDEIREAGPRMPEAAAT